MKIGVLAKSMDLSHLSDRELLTHTGALVGSQRELTAKLVAHLTEIEGRRLHLEASFSSMFEYCVKELRMSDGEAFRRIVAARLGRRFPLVHSLLASGAVNLSALALLRPYLTEDNHSALLAAASGKTKSEVEALLAERFPKPDVPSSIRWTGGACALVDSSRSCPKRGVLNADTSESHEAGRGGANRARIEALSKTRFRVEFTASGELRSKLERCRDLMSHANPSRELGVVVERAVDLLLAELEKTRLASTVRLRSKAGEERAPTTRVEERDQTPGSLTVATPVRVPRAVRRRVFERDGTRCTFVSASGRRCEATAFLELDHVEPKALGGGNDFVNLRVLCRAHNQLAAEKAYGRHLVERSRHFRQHQCASTRDERRLDGEPASAPSSSRSSSLHASPSEISNKVLVVLKGLGFRDTEARRAIAQVERQGAGPPPSLEQALRQALLCATERLCG